MISNRRTNGRGNYSYQGKTYTDACTSVDVEKGDEWCFLPEGAKDKNGERLWGMCAEKMRSGAQRRQWFDVE